MNHSMINAMVSMSSLQQKLDVIANNMANTGTVGFKRKEATFEDILTNIKSQPPGFQKEGRLSPPGFNQGWGAKLSLVQLNMEQGPLKETGVDSDMAIEGNGLFEIEHITVDANGNNVTNIAYTRDGSFDLVVNPDDPDNLYLATKAGDYVRGTDNLPIRVPAGNGYKMAVSAEGVVTAYKPGDTEATEEVGQLKLLRVIRPQYLEQTGDNLFAIAPGTNVGDVLQDANAATELENKPTVRQGFLEQSNVNLSDEMTDLIMVQRAYQLSSRAITSSDTMMGLANNLRA